MKTVALAAVVAVMVGCGGEPSVEEAAFEEAVEEASYAESNCEDPASWDPPREDFVYENLDVGNVCVGCFWRVNSPGQYLCIAGESARAAELSACEDLLAFDRCVCEMTHVIEDGSRTIWPGACPVDDEDVCPTEGSADDGDCFRCTVRFHCSASE